MTLSSLSAMVLPVDFLGKWGGIVPTEAEIESKLRRLEVVAV